MTRHSAIKTLLSSNESLLHAKYNPVFELIVTRSGRGFGVFRLSDCSKLCEIFVKDYAAVVGYDWDQLTGQFISIAYNDGTLRIYDVFRGGKLVLYMRSNTMTKSDCSYWDRVRCFKNDDVLCMDVDLTESMPLVVKFVKDGRSKKIKTVSYVPMSSIWRQLPEDIEKKCSEVIDVHIVHDPLNDQFCFFLNGAFDVKDNSVTDPRAEEMLKIVSCQQNVYVCFYNDFAYRTIDLNGLMNCDVRRKILNISIQGSNLAKLLKDNIELIKKELVIPYKNFLKLLCVDANDGYDAVYQQMKNFILIGQLNEDFANWLKFTVGERNFKIWKELGRDLYEKFVQIISFAILPALEKMILHRETLDSLLKYLCHTEECRFANDAITNVSVTLQFASTLYTNALNIVPTLNSGNKKFSDFIDWVGDSIDTLLDKNSRHNTTLDTPPTFTSNVSTIMQLHILNNGQVFEDAVKNLELPLGSMIESLQTFETEYAKPVMKNKIRITSVQTGLETSSSKLLDVVARPKTKEFDFLMLQNRSEPVYTYGTLDAKTMSLNNIPSPLSLSKPDQIHNTTEIDTAQIITHSTLTHTNPETTAQLLRQSLTLHQHQTDPEYSSTVPSSTARKSVIIKLRPLPQTTNSRYIKTQLKASNAKDAMNTSR